MLRALIIIFGAALLTSCQPKASNDPALAAIETLIEVHNTLEMDLLRPILSADFVRTAPDVSTAGIQEYESYLREFHDRFSTFNMRIDHMVRNEAGGFIKWSVSGTYIGPGAAPNGSDINVTGLGYYEYENGKLTSEFIGFNPGWFRAQLPQP